MKICPLLSMTTYQRNRRLHHCIERECAWWKKDHCVLHDIGIVWFVEVSEETEAEIREKTKGRKKGGKSGNSVADRKEKG